MRCSSCQSRIPAHAAYCPACGAAQPKGAEAAPVDASISVAAPGTWWWLLLVLLAAERLLAVYAFRDDEARWLARGWEGPFLWVWGAGLGLPAAALLALRKRPGGWLAFLSGGALSLRACVPMLGEGHAAEQQVYGAVLSLMVASATLTFAFLYEQSHWAEGASEKAVH